VRFNWRLLAYQLSTVFLKPRHPVFRFGVRRLRFYGSFAALFIIGQGMAWLHFLLDTLFFPRFRRAKVEGPVFVIGNFRSGTTFLHRLLWQDAETFTSLTTREIYVTPSVSQRKLWDLLLAVDRRLGGRFARFLEHIDADILGNIRFHRVGLEQTEEDEGLLLYLWESLFTWFFFPTKGHERDFFDFDRRVPPGRRRRILRFYDMCIRRHVYAHRTSRLVLSKNPSFSAKVRSVAREFPNARFIYVRRRPEEVVPSMINWFSFVWHYFGNPEERFPYSEDIADLAGHWQTHALRELAELPEERVHIVDFDDLVGDVSGTVRAIYRHFGIPLSAGMAETLEQAQRESQSFIPHARLSLADVGIDGESLSDRFHLPPVS
jgi:hypothetical protein